MKCMECSEKAEWVLLGDSSTDYQTQLLCETHLQEIIQYEGEINLDFYRIEETNWPLIITEVNKKIKYLSEMYTRILGEYSTLKKAQNATKEDTQ